MKGMIALLIFVLASCSSGDSEENPPNNRTHPDARKADNTKNSQIADPNNIFSFNLLKQVEPDDDNNVFISPMSAFMALSMVYNGADGETKDEMAETLQATELDEDMLNELNAELISKLHSYSSIELNIANSIWINDWFTFEEAFQNQAEDYYQAELFEFDVEDPDSPMRMNQWVEEATNNKIKDVVESPLDRDLVAFLFNAIYFKGDWQYEFDERLTEDHPFHMDTEKTKNMPLMYLEEDLNYMENEQVQAVELPYNDGEASMHVFLPKENVGLQTFLEEITYDTWNDWYTAFTETEGTLMLPKFELEYEVGLNKPLTELGMPSAFDRSKADFSKMVQELGGDDRLWIHEVKQKAFIEVNEEGTEAAAATSVELRTESYEVGKETFHMIVNRPFFLTITDNETGLILFMGAISDPHEIE